jgi:hypothetical protein
LPRYARNDEIRNFKNPSLLFAMPFQRIRRILRLGGTVLHHVSTT